ncbi:NAD+ synthase [Rhizobium sp. OAE497]
MSPEQKSIIEALGVHEHFDAEHEVIRRCSFLEDYCIAASRRSFVLGISGGVDSLTAGLLAQKSVARLRSGGHQAEFIAVRLPYGDQADKSDAQACLSTIQPDRVITLDVKPASDAIMSEISRNAPGIVDGDRYQFHLGNIKARQRMIAQYALAGATRGLVIGTDHAAEALMGFYTKFGDGAADVLPLAGLNKRRVRALAKFLGAPESLVLKVPTADLESDAPLKPDEDAYGVTYDEIDDFLEGREISVTSRNRMLAMYYASGHKRTLPATPI